MSKYPWEEDKSIPIEVKVDWYRGEESQAANLDISHLIKHVFESEKRWVDPSQIKYLTLIQHNVKEDDVRLYIQRLYE
jgi:hypothetical protein